MLTGGEATCHVAPGGLSGPAQKSTPLQLCSCCCWGSAAEEIKQSLEKMQSHFWMQHRYALPLHTALQAGNCLPSGYINYRPAHTYELLHAASKACLLLQEFSASPINKSLNFRVHHFWIVECVSAMKHVLNTWILVKGERGTRGRSKSRTKDMDIKKSLSFSC